MKIFAEKDIRHFFYAIAVCMTGFLIVTHASAFLLYRDFSMVLFFLLLVEACAILAICFFYFRRQNEIMESAVSKIDAFLSGDTDVRIDCDYEGELYRLFHSVNTLAAVLNAHAEKELQAKEFLKNTISDISHQLKTPLAALNIYNGLLQGEAEELPTDASEEIIRVKEFVTLSEKELDRIEVLVQNLLKITKLDAGMMITEKAPENVSDMMHDIALHFAYRSKEEQKEILLSGADDITFLCDRDWIIEAVSNLVKNALDHMRGGNTVRMEWKQSASIVQIRIKDDGSGIHPEDMPHIFKRFYRSRFSKDTQGIGLGLPLAKAIIEAHGGTIEVSSELGRGACFIINFLAPAQSG